MPSHEKSKRERAFQIRFSKADNEYQSVKEYLSNLNGTVIVSADGPFEYQDWLTYLELLGNRIAEHNPTDIMLKNFKNITELCDTYEKKEQSYTFSWGKYYVNRQEIENTDDGLKWVNSTVFNIYLKQIKRLKKYISDRAYNHVVGKIHQYWEEHHAETFSPCFRMLDWGIDRCVSELDRLDRIKPERLTDEEKSNIKEFTSDLKYYKEIAEFLEEEGQILSRRQRARMDTQEKELCELIDTALDYSFTWALPFAEPSIYLEHGELTGIEAYENIITMEDDHGSQISYAEALDMAKDMMCSEIFPQTTVFVWDDDDSLSNEILQTINDMSGNCYWEVNLYAKTITSKNGTKSVHNSKRRKLIRRAEAVIEFNNYVEHLYKLRKGVSNKVPVEAH